MSRRFHIVDVFARKRYEGNQLAVVQDGRDLSDEEMQAIAREMNYSETTFILSGGGGEEAFPVRIFTPESEVPFAGHPTLGTAYIIQRHVIGRPVERLVLDLKAGKIPVTFEAGEGMDLLWMTQNAPQFGPSVDSGALAQALGLSAGDLAADLPAQEVSTGLPFLIAPLRSLDAVRRARVNRDCFFPLVEQTRARAVLVFARGSYEPANDLNVRVFVDYYGIPEDPATGSANGCLAAYLSRYGVLGSDVVEARVEQGFEIHRPSLLFLKARPAGETIDVRVGGAVIPVAGGELI
jgi:trans-2,3-dihydro-3-hydroxyanthranilate isomerase